MFLTGQKIINEDGQQGYVDEITNIGGVVVGVLSHDCIDPQVVKVVKDGYPSKMVDDMLTHTENQQPCIDDLTRFGIVRKIERLAEGILFCKFDLVEGDIDHDATGIWLSEFRRSNEIDEWEDAYWVKGKYLDDVLEAFDLEMKYRVATPKGLSHEDTAFECVAEVLLPDGQLRQWTASVNDNGEILEIEVESDEMEYANSITDLKELGIEKAQLISTYEIKGFDPIK